MFITRTMDACFDCISFIANGEAPDDRDIAAEIAARHGEGAHLVIAYHGPDWFSHRPCECCGSPLGGDRNMVCILMTE